LPGFGHDFARGRLGTLLRTVAGTGVARTSHHQPTPAQTSQRQLAAPRHSAKSFHARQPTPIRPPIPDWKRRHTFARHSPRRAFAGLSGSGPLAGAFSSPEAVVAVSAVSLASRPVFPAFCPGRPAFHPNRLSAAGCRSMLQHDRTHSLHYLTAPRWPQPPTKRPAHGWFLGELRPPDRL
jgi:hypothetical protein